MERCEWCGQDPLYVAYHDEEWGHPEGNSRALWEKLILDGFQAGLSWITILRKRQNFRQAFKGFNPEVIAHWGPSEVHHLLQDAGIIRHRGKIEATILNARAFLNIQESQGFAPFLWDFVDGAPLQGRFVQQSDVPTFTKTAASMSKALKAKGFKFCGPTITYAFMQATGLVNDHLLGCPCHQKVAKLGQQITLS